VKKFAFTLIEMIAVIMVIAIIIGIALPRFGGIQEEALQTKVRGELRTIQSALESYYINQTPNAYPETTSAVIEEYLLAASPQIVSQILLDPFQGDEYDYVLSDNNRYYVVLSVGINGASDITGIDDEGFLQGTDIDDIFATNGSGWSTVP
jgi:prepilin-type N-terminal cleavage/methylation domain-containing protein